MKAKNKMINIPKIYGPYCCYKDLESDFSLPDYLPDISRLIKIEAVPEINGISFDEKCTVSIKLTFGVLYESDYKQKLSYASITSDISLKCEFPDDSEVFPFPSAEITYLSCRLLGQRKIAIKAKCQASTMFYTKNELCVADEYTDDLSVFYKTGSYTALAAAFSSEINGEYKEIIRADMPVFETVCSKINLSSPEKIKTDNTLIIKANAYARLLCESDGSYNSITQTVPFELTLTDDRLNTAEAFAIKLSVRDISAFTDLDEYGESKAINLKFAIKADIIAFERVEITAPDDGFCEKSGVKCQFCDASYDSKDILAEKMFAFEKTYKAENDGIGRILDVDTAFEITEKRVENGKITLKGRSKTNLLAENNDLVSAFTFTDDFEESIESDSIDEIVDDAEIFVFEQKADIVGSGSVCVRAMCCLSLSCHSRSQIHALTSLEGLEPSELIRSGIVFYYPDKEEDIWSIAKKYRVNPKKLSDLNRNSIDSSGRLTDKQRFICIK